MKKISIFMLAVILSFGLNEFLLHYIICYPTYGAEKKVYGLSKYYKSTVLYNNTPVKI